MSMIRNGSIYAQTARFDSQARALTEDELRTMAPSIFATTAHESRSERFRPIPTIEIVRGLAKEGFSVVGARQAVARDPGKAPFTKHLLRIRRLDNAAHKAGDSVLEMLLKNGNDGSSAYDLMAGMFRVLCLNSLVAQTSTIDTVKVRHSGDVMGKVIEGTYRVVQEAEQLLAAPADWGRLQLTADHRNAFAQAAHVLRFGDAEGNVTTPIQPAALLAPRRYEDRANDLWTTFNVVQENVVRGGLTGFGRNVNNQMRRTTTRQIKGIDQDVKLNKALWVLAEALKKAAA